MDIRGMIYKIKHTSGKIRKMQLISGFYLGSPTSDSEGLAIDMRTGYHHGCTLFHLIECKKRRKILRVYTNITGTFNSGNVLETK
jgi:hypothetical protein